MSVKPVKVDDVRQSHGLSDTALKVVDTLTEFINAELGRPENWKKLFAIDTRERPNPNEGVRLTIPQLEEVAGVPLTDEIIEAVIARYTDHTVGWEVQNAFGMKPPMLIFKP